jgi:hypothetical protein
MPIVAFKAGAVVVHDLNDTAPQLDVTAETLYEVGAQTLPWCAVTTGSATSEQG